MVTGFPYFIDYIYNQKRLHKAFGYQPPDEFVGTLFNQENKGDTQVSYFDLNSLIIGM